MKVKMLKTVKGSEDGIRIKSYHSGLIYDISENLTLDFISLGAVELIAECENHSSKMEEDFNNKAILGAPKNKRGKKE